MTIPLFEVDGHHARTQSGIEVFALIPLVYPEQRQAWEKYSVENQGWLEESRKIVVSGEGNLESTSYVDAPISSVIYEVDEAWNPIPSPPDQDVSSTIAKPRSLPFGTFVSDKRYS